MGRLLNQRETNLAVVLYSQGCSLIYIARQLNRSRTSIHNVLVRCGVKLRKNKWNAVPQDPTPEEIERETEKIREGWQDGEAEHRVTGPYEFPSLSNLLKVS